MNDSEMFDVIPDDVGVRGQGGGPLILSGAMWAGETKTRLIENIVLVQSLGILQRL